MKLDIQNKLLKKIIEVLDEADNMPVSVHQWKEGLKKVMKAKNEETILDKIKIYTRER